MNETIMNGKATDELNPEDSCAVYRIEPIGNGEYQSTKLDDYPCLYRDYVDDWRNHYEDTDLYVLGRSVLPDGVEDIRGAIRDQPQFVVACVNQHGDVLYEGLDRVEDNIVFW